MEEEDHANLDEGEQAKGERYYYSHCVTYYVYFLINLLLFKVCIIFAI